MSKKKLVKKPKPKSIQSMGGMAVLKKYGPEHMSKIQKKRWANHRKENQE